MGMSSFDVERQYVDLFISYSPADRAKVRALKYLLRRHRAPPVAPPIDFGPAFDETVITLHELAESAQACSTPAMLERHLEFSIASLRDIRRRRGRH